MKDRVARSGIGLVSFLVVAAVGVLLVGRQPQTGAFKVVDTFRFTRQIVYRDSPVRPDASFALPSAQPLASGAQVRYVSPESE